MAGLATVNRAVERYHKIPTPDPIFSYEEGIIKDVMVQYV